MVVDDDRAKTALLLMPAGKLHDMSKLQPWLREELACCVKPKGLRDVVRRFP